MGMTTIKTGSPVIDAKGMSPLDVLHQLRRSIEEV
ncbi:MAG: hypothetical protein ACYC21_15580 [Eubacteriales bacterium]